MPTCLVALGSNLGSREALVDEALAELAVAGPVLRHSRLYRSRPVGGPPGQGEFVNAAAVVETALEPLPLLRLLQEIETRHDRQRGVRWAPRTLDLDLLLYDDVVLDTAELTLPHPRMSFRRFVLEPAAEVAGQMSHPTIGWTIGRLLDHLNNAADQVAILAAAQDERQRLATVLTERLPVYPIAPPAGGSAAPSLWPSQCTTWLALNPDMVAQGAARDIPGPAALARAAPAAGRPKLTIISDIDASTPRDPAEDPAVVADWPSLRRLQDRGPTLVLRTTDPDEAAVEAVAAIQAVWPQLCLPAPGA